MKLQKRVFLLTACSLFWSIRMSQGAGADDRPSTLFLDLPTAVERALEDNPALRAKRQALGSAHGRVQQAELLFQDNPRLSVDVDYRHRRFALPTGKSGVDTEVRLLQEVEIAGQRGYRWEAAAKNLAQAEWSIVDAERLLRLEVTQAFYDLMASQEKIAAQRQLLTTQEDLLQAGLERFARGDISVLELDTLRLDRDRARKDLSNREQEWIGIEQQLRSLLGLEGENTLSAVGNLVDVVAQQAERKTPPPLGELAGCALETRPDLKAAHLTLEGREAELRLAQARRTPNISLGPLYKLDNEDQVIGGAIAVPLPLFNRNQGEITTALANLSVARTELEARRLAVRQEVATAYTRVRLAEERLAPYEKTYPDNLTQSASFTRKAYETGEISIFEFSVAQDRVAQARFLYMDAILAYLQATAELDARLAFACPARAESETSRRGKQNGH